MKEHIKRVLNFKKPSRVIIVVAIALTAVLITGFAVNRARAIELPSTSELQYVTINQFINYAPIGEVVVSDKDEITQILNSLSGATKRWGINGMSVYDRPLNENYLLVLLHLNNEVRTLYLYADGANCIEEPYVGIYRARTSAGFNYLFSVYNDCLNLNSQTDAVPSTTFEPRIWIDSDFDYKHLS